MTYRERRHLKSAFVGPVVGALVGLLAFAVIAVITSSPPIWWWLCGAAAGAVGGFTLGPIMAAERDDGEVAEARTAKHAVGDADAPVEGAERRDVRTL
jgi:hypothetical protein